MVDDEPDARDMLATLLVQEGATARAAASSPEAIALLEASRFDVVVADIGMPGEDGYQFIGKVQQLPSALEAKIPVIALTGYGRAQDAQRTSAAGFAAHLTKPVVLSDLLSAILRTVHPPSTQG